MATSARQVLATRIERDAAKGRLDAHVAKLKADYEKRGISGRIVDEMTDKAIAAFDETANIAGDNKGIVAGTIGLLAIWFLRHPIVSAFRAIFDDAADEEGYETDDYE